MEGKRKILVQLELIQRLKSTVTPRILENWKIKCKITTVNNTEIENYNEKELHLNIQNKQ